MQISLPVMIQNNIAQQLRVSHLEKKVDCKVVEGSKLSQTVKDKIKEDKGEEFLKKIDILMGFVLEGGDTTAQADKEQDTKDSEEENKEEDSQNQEEVDSTEKEEEEKENTEQEEPSEDNSEDNSESDEEDSTEEEETSEDDEKKKDKKSLNESDMQIKDLTSSMLSTIKENKKKTKKKQKKANRCCRGPVMPYGPVPPPPPPPGPGPQPGPEPGPEPGPAPDGGMMEEAETEATGTELVSKVTKMLSKMFKANESDTNKIELLAVKDIPNAYYAVLSFGKSEENSKEQ